MPISVYNKKTQDSIKSRLGYDDVDMVNMVKRLLYNN